MANEQNLKPRPFNTMTVEEQKKIASMGGKKRTPQKKFKARLRELKKKGLTDDTVKKLVNIIEDPECSVLDIRIFLDSIKGENISSKEKIKLANSYIKLHQAHHGIKLKGNIDHHVEAVVVNIIPPKGEE